MLQFLKAQCAREPALFKQFGKAVRMFNDSKMSALDVVSQVDDLFSNKPFLRASFNALMPFDEVYLC